MDSEIFSPSRDVFRCCDCGCNCSLTIGSASSWMRSVKRKYDEFEEANEFHVQGLDPDLFSNARVQIENECELLRETVSSQLETIQELYAELEEERNAASTAANETMSMMLRLQSEKAEIQMEFRQFKRFAEDKIEHDRQEILALEDLLYTREQTVEALTYEVQAYKHRMMSYGLTEAEAEVGENSEFDRFASMIDTDAHYDLPAYGYPSLKCNSNENPCPCEADINIADVEQDISAGSPLGQQHMKSLEHRIGQMESNSSFFQLDGDFGRARTVLENVVVDQTPRQPRHFGSVSNDSSSSSLGIVKEASSKFYTDLPRYDNGSLKMKDVFQTDVIEKDDGLEVADDMSDRVYTIDSVHNRVLDSDVPEGKSGIELGDNYVTTPRESLIQPDIGDPDFGDPDIKKLYMRLQALEADRESMRQAILSMQTEKAQLVLLKEIALHLSKEIIPEKHKALHKASTIGAFSLVSIFKWIASFVCWRKRARRSKYMFGMSVHNRGLLMVLDKGPQKRQWRCLMSTQV